MKKIILTLSIAFALQSGYAQKSPFSISKGTWVVESNINSPKNQVIKFYNSSFELIHEEIVTDKKIRYGNKRIKTALNKTLEMALNNEQSVKPGTFAMVLKNPKIAPRL